MGAQVEDFQDPLRESCKRQLIEEDKIVLTDSGYHLTERGMKVVRKELERYEFRPALQFMIETYILNRFEVQVWE